VTVAGITVPVLAAGLGSAFFFAMSSVSKHVSAGQGPDAPSLRVGAIGRFALATVRHPLWLAGTVADVAGLALQVIALHLGALAVVQPLMLSGLVFAILLRGAVARRLSARQALWAVVIAAALGSFLVISNGGTAPAHAAVDRLPAVISAACGLGLVVFAMSSGARARVLNTRAGLMGVAAGTIYAATAALIKSVSDLALRGFVPFITGWQLYALIVIGAAGLVVGQIAFRAGPMSAALPVASTVDPLLSIVLGVAIYDERVRLGPGHGALLAVLLGVLCVAVVRLARMGDVGSAANADGVPSGPEERFAAPERVDVPLASHR
jgi:hypothetical protein